MQTGSKIKPYKHGMGGEIKGNKLINNSSSRVPLSPQKTESKGLNHGGMGDKLQSLLPKKKDLMSRKNHHNTAANFVLNPTISYTVPVR